MCDNRTDSKAVLTLEDDGTTSKTPRSRVPTILAVVLAAGTIALLVTTSKYNLKGFHLFSVRFLSDSSKIKHLSQFGRLAFNTVGVIQASIRKKIGGPHPNCA